MIQIKNLSVAKALLLSTLLLVLSACSEFITDRRDLPAGIDPGFRLSLPEDGIFNIDHQFAQVAQDVPGFAGLYYNDAGVLTALVKDTDELDLQGLTTLSSPLAGAIREVFGEDALTPTAVFDEIGELSTLKMDGLSAQSTVPQLQVLPAQYSFNELASARHTAEVGGLWEVDGVVLLDLNERQNRLVVGVSSAEAKAKAEEKLAQLRLAPAAVVEVVDPPRELANLRDQVRPLLGGLQLTWGPYNNSNWFCTFGFVAVRNGVRGFVTNSHCTGNQLSLTNMAFRQPNANSPIVGNEQAEAGTWACGSSRCRYSDSAFVRISGATSSLGRIAYLAAYYAPTSQITNQYTITGTANPVVGQTLIKVGRTTGETYGRVSQTGVTVDTGDGILTQGSFFVDRPSGISAKISSGGDSGSPVFSISSGLNITLRGVLYCGPTSDSGAYFCGSPISEVFRSLGTMTVR